MVWMRHAALTVRKEKYKYQKIAEAEIVGVRDYLPYKIHLVMFMKHQGYHILDNIVFQDYKSAINM